MAFNFRLIVIVLTAHWVLSQPASSWNQTPLYSDFGNSNNFNQNTNYLILIINASEAPVRDLIKVNISKLHHKAFFNKSGMSSRYSNCTNRGKEGRKGREGKCIFWAEAVSVALQCIGERKGLKPNIAQSGPTDHQPTRPINFNLSFYKYTNILPPPPLLILVDGGSSLERESKYAS